MTHCKSIAPITCCKCSAIAFSVDLLDELLAVAPSVAGAMYAPPGPQNPMTTQCLCKPLFFFHFCMLPSATRRKQQTEPANGGLRISITATWFPPSFRIMVP